jgi:FAD/FMN-containing dehydrogenase
MPGGGPGWRLSGRGGGGNFGVVTEFQFQLHPVGPLAQLGLFFWDLEDGEAALALAQQVTAGLPPRMAVQDAIPTESYSNFGLAQGLLRRIHRGLTNL